MPRKVLIFVLLILILIMSACGSESPDSNLVPIEETAGNTDATEEDSTTSTPNTEGLTSVEEETVESDMDANAVDVSPYLAGNTWGLTELNGQTPIEDSYITATFTDEGTITGSAGCNSYSAPVTVDSNQITFGQAIMTRKICFEEIMNQEMVFMEILEDAHTFEVSEGRLVFFDGDFQARAIFETVSQELAGSSWEVISYNNGKGGVVSVLTGTELTAVFGAEGQLSGNAGCNDYFGSYQLEGENLSIGSIGATMKACLEPTGVMEQEAQFLVALESVETYKIDGLSMTMVKMDGATAINLSRLLTPNEGDEQLDESSQPEASAVSGYITFLGDSNLAADTILTVQIQDTSRADAVAEVIGEQVILSPGQFPIEFQVAYDPQQIVDNHSYSLSAKITMGDGALSYINSTNIPVISRGNPTANVEIEVIEIAG